MHGCAESTERPLSDPAPHGLSDAFPVRTAQISTALHYGHVGTRFTGRCGIAEKAHLKRAAERGLGQTASARVRRIPAHAFESVALTRWHTHASVQVESVPLRVGGRLRRDRGHVTRHTESSGGAGVPRPPPRARRRTRRPTPRASGTQGEGPLPAIRRQPRALPGCPRRVRGPRSPGAAQGHRGRDAALPRRPRGRCHWLRVPDLRWWDDDVHGRTAWRSRSGSAVGGGDAGVNA